MSTDPFDLLFRQGRLTRFDPSHDPSWTPQEGRIGYGEISPYGFLEPGSVDNAQLVDGAITNTKITDGSISTPKLAANAVTADKLMVGDVSNALTNPGFETGDMSGWAAGVVTGTGAVVVTNTRAHGGVYSVAMQPGVSGTTQLLADPYTPAGPGEVVILGAWIYGSSSPQVGMNVACYDASKAYLGSVGATQAITNGAWDYYAQSAKTLAGTAFIRPNIQCNTASASAYVDDVYLGRGGVAIDSNGITLMDATGSTALTSAGFGPTWQRFLLSGLFNGDFFAGTPTPASDLHDATNPLPYWSAQRPGGSSVGTGFKWTADTTQGSGGRVDFTLKNGGTAADEEYLEQIVPISAAADQNTAYYVLASIQVSASPIASIYVETQFLKSDRVTPTGSAQHDVRGLLGFPASSVQTVKALNPGIAMYPPADAYYMRVRFGFIRGTDAATTDTDTLKLYGMQVVAAPDSISVSDQDPTYPPAVITLNKGVVDFPAQAVSASWFQSGSADDSTYIVTEAGVLAVAAGAWYKVAPLGGCSFVPSFAGQRFIITWSGAYTADKAANTLVAVRIDKDTAGTIKRWQAIQQIDNPTTGKFRQVGGATVFTADNTDVGVARYIYFYVRSSVANTTFSFYGGSDYATQIHASDIP